jgi:hypothetical protein
MIRLRVLIFPVLLVACLVGASTILPSHSNPGAGWLPVHPVVAAASSPCPSYTALTSAIPSDMAVPTSQSNANCFAWQEFIALNWTGQVSTCAADPSVQAASFGTPLDNNPKVWELYKQDTDIFLPGAAAPSAWCSQSQVVPSRFRSLTASRLLAAAGSAGHPKFLSAISKDANDPQVKLTQCLQAGTASSCEEGGWLTAQSGIIALYEIRVNQDEFAYIDSNGLYNAVTQQTFVQKPGINLPDGTSGTGPGSIELKASWIELDDPSMWPYYKTSQALVSYPNNPTPKLVTVGLTGLHIIHKTGRSPQFIWATFEHVHNAPSTTDISSHNLLPWYTFYNANCNPATDHYQCVANAQINGGTPQKPYFPQSPADPYNAPVQVVRQNPLSSSTTDNIVAINAWAQALIAGANPNSVFQNYELVDVLWSNTPTQIPAGATTPLTAGNPQPNPSLEFVANTTLETYMQNTATCSSCHVYAPIAQASSANLRGNVHKGNVAPSISPAVHAFLLRPSIQSGNTKALASTTPLLASSPTYASDYSFLFSSAQSPSTQAAATVRRLRLNPPPPK